MHIDTLCDTSDQLNLHGGQLHGRDTAEQASYQTWAVPFVIEHSLGAGHFNFAPLNTHNTPLLVRRKTTLAGIRSVARSVFLKNKTITKKNFF